jgi:hypothetical protein
MIDEVLLTLRRSCRNVGRIDPWYVHELVASLVNSCKTSFRRFLMVRTYQCFLFPVDSCSLKMSSSRSYRGVVDELLFHQADVHDD